MRDRPGNDEIARIFLGMTRIAMCRDTSSDPRFGAIAPVRLPDKKGA